MPILRGRKSTLSFRLYLSMPASCETDTDVKTRFSSRSTQQQAVQTLLTWVAASSTRPCGPAAGGSLRSIPSSRCKRYRQAYYRPRISALGKSMRSTRIGVLEPRDARRTSDDVGGARRDRTDDLLLAKQALSQLSYGPVGRVGSGPTETRSQKAAIDVRLLTSEFWLLIAGISHLIVVGLGRLELPTSRLSGVRSNHLSYRPDLPCLRSCLKKEKRRRRNPALF